MWLGGHRVHSDRPGSTGARHTHARTHARTPHNETYTDTKANKHANKQTPARLKLTWFIRKAVLAPQTVREAALGRVGARRTCHTHPVLLCRSLLTFLQHPPRPPRCLDS
eukprot:2670602-Rhodomonas_salina.1